jgi:YVTN family beta-propeller protein
MPNRSAAATAVVFLLGTGALWAGGCGFGESGIEPPLDRIFLPGGMAADRERAVLYAVNSNSDLRFNNGTVVVVDAAKASLDYQKTTWPVCPSPGYLPDENGPGTCCWDFFDNRVLNCDDRMYIDRQATVRIGSFGGNALIDPPVQAQDATATTPAVAAKNARLYVAVRSEPSVTFMDLATPTAMDCGAGTGAGRVCDNDHKIRGDYNNSALSALKLVEEPHAMTLDSELGLLYVGHLIEGLSLVSTCGPKPTMLTVDRRIFYNGRQGFAVTSILLPTPGDARAPVLVTGRNYNYYGPGEVQSLTLKGIAGGCDGSDRTGAELVESEGFYSSAFYQYGADIRGMVIEGNRAYLLQRNATIRQNAPVVVEIDQTPDAQGHPFNRAVGLVETCAGATEMQAFDAGRGLRLYVTCFEAGQVYVIDPSPLAVVGVINVGRGPTTMVLPKPLTKDGQKTGPLLAYVLGFSDNNVSVVDLDPANPTENRVIQRIGFPQLRKR